MAEQRQCGADANGVGGAERVARRSGLRGEVEWRAKWGRDDEAVRGEAMWWCVGGGSEEASRAGRKSSRTKRASKVKRVAKRPGGELGQG